MQIFVRYLLDINKQNYKTKIKVKRFSIEPKKSQMLKQFIDSYKKSLPIYYNTLIQKLSHHPTLVVHHPIIAYPSTHPLSIKIKTIQNSQPVPKNVSILMLSQKQSFNNVELIGANTKQLKEVDEFFQKNIQKYEILRSQDLINLFKIIIQIYANQMQIQQGSMPLHHFANLIMNQVHHCQKQKQNILNQLGLQIDLEKYQKHIKSHHLLNILKSNEKIVQLLYEVLCQNFIRIAQQSEFLKLVKLVRLQLRQIHQTVIIEDKNFLEPEKVQVLAPIFSSLGQSTTPNCVLVGKYFTHLRGSYYSVQTLRQIKPGEQLTIERKRGMSNYDKMIRYGCRSVIEHPDNPDNFYPIIINFMDPSIQEVNEIVMSSDINQKKAILNVNNLEMTNMVRIAKNGKLMKDDLRLLRILFGIVNQLEIDSEQSKVDNKINSFIGRFVRLNYERHINQYGNRNEMKVVGEDQFMKCFRIVEQDEINILSHFLEKNRIK